MPFSYTPAVSPTSTNNEHMQFLVSDPRHPDQSNDAAARVQHVVNQSAGMESSVVTVYLLKL
jgi:hypothetical protein